MRPYDFALGVFIGFVTACSSPAPLQGEGGACLQVTDCQLGLVCVMASDGSHHCSSHLDSTVKLVDGGAFDPTAAAALEAGGNGE